MSGFFGSASDLRPALQTSGFYLPADSIQFNTGTQAASANVLSFMPFSRKCNIDAIAIQVTTAGAAGNSVRGGLYTAHPATGMPHQLIEEGTPQAIDSTGIKAITLAAARAVTEMVWLAVVFQAGCTVRNNSTAEEAAHILGLANMTGPANNRITATFTYAALPADTSGLTMSADATSVFVGARID